MSTLLQSCRAAVGGPDRDSGPLLAGILDAGVQQANLIAPDRLADTTARLVEAATAMDACAVYGASDIGHFLSGAMTLALNSLRLWQPGSREPVVLIDGVIAAAAGIELAASRARAMGASDVQALVLRVLRPATIVESGAKPTRLIEVLPPPLAAAA